MAHDIRYTLDNTDYQKVVEFTEIDLDTGKPVVTQRRLVTIDKNAEVLKLTNQIQKLQSKLDELNSL